MKRRLKIGSLRRTPTSKDLVAEGIVLRHGIAVVGTIPFELSFNRLIVGCDCPNVLGPTVPFLIAEYNPRSNPAVRRRWASSRVNTPTESQRVLPSLGELGGVSPKSPGFRLCAGLPLYSGRPSEAMTSRRDSSLSGLQTRRLGLKDLRGGMIYVCGHRLEVADITKNSGLSRGWLVDRLRLLYARGSVWVGAKCSGSRRFWSSR